MIERLYNAEQQMSVMLHSPYIGPLRDEAASWIEKLKVLDETLGLWIAVQTRWLFLVPIYRDQADSLPKVFLFMCFIEKHDRCFLFKDEIFNVNDLII